MQLPGHSKYLADIGYVGRMALVASIFIPVGLAISRASLIGLQKGLQQGNRTHKYGNSSCGNICLFTANNAIMTIIGTTLIGMGLAATFPLLSAYSERSTVRCRALLSVLP